MARNDWDKHGKNWSKRRVSVHGNNPETRSGNTKMPFGKYKGQTFHQIPKDYLEWLLTFEGCKEQWKGEILLVLEQWKTQSYLDSKCVMGKRSVSHDSHS